MSGVEFTVRLTRRQAGAVLRSTLSVGHGVMRSQDLVEAEQRLMTAIRDALGVTEVRHSPGDVEVVESRSAGWVFRCHRCAITESGMTEQRANDRAAEHANTTRGDAR